MAKTAEASKKALFTKFHSSAPVFSASDKYDPSEVANYAYNLARTYNKFYHESPILSAPTEDEKQVRVALSGQTGVVLKKAMNLLGIEVPEKM